MSDEATVTYPPAECTPALEFRDLGPRHHDAPFAAFFQAPVEDIPQDAWDAAPKVVWEKGYWAEP